MSWWFMVVIDSGAAFMPTWISPLIPLLNQRRYNMTWSTPAFTDFRFGFEITLYIANR